jgi:hypothetical protein
MKSERIRWKRTRGRQQLLLNKVYDAITEEFTRDAIDFTAFRRIKV